MLAPLAVAQKLPKATIDQQREDTCQHYSTFNYKVNLTQKHGVMLN